ncbi:MAG: hypothetical protein GEU75_07740 [Dehalococcoidia bacterium]|nr:hypothetical protein [Dehalococcoidia bacterium]
MSCTGTALPGGAHQEECTSSSKSLLEDGDDRAVLLLTAIPLAFTATALALTRRAGYKALRWLLASVFLCLCLLTGFTIGIFYLPAALISLAAVAADRRQPL